MAAGELRKKLASTITIPPTSSGYALSCRPAPMRLCFVRSTRLCTRKRRACPSTLTKRAGAGGSHTGTSRGKRAMDAPNDLVDSGSGRLGCCLRPFMDMVPAIPTQSARCLRFVLGAGDQFPNPVLLCMGQMRATRVQLDPNALRNPFSAR